MYTQREKERRSFVGKTVFPLIAKGGYLVETDRRSVPDRRLCGIYLELTDTVDQKYSAYFTNSVFQHQSKKTA